MIYEPADFFFAAGEASGDLEASLLAGAAKKIQPQLTLCGLGGERMRAAGVKLLYETTELASIGPLSIIPKIPQLWFLLHGLDRSMRRNSPGVFIPVDAGAFNLRLAKLLRQRAFSRPIIYYFPPGAWLDDWEKAKMVSALTYPLTPFAHQRDFYQKNDLRIAYFGHPLVSVIPPRASKALAARPVIAVLPGSRHEEVVHHLPVLARTAAELERVSGATFYAVAASAQRERQILRDWRRFGGASAFFVTRESVAEALVQADLAWIAAGTAVLEAALLKVPQVSFYVLSKAQRRVAARVLPQHLQKRIALPNLVLDRDVVPELLQDDFTVANLRNRSLALLENEKFRSSQLSSYDELRAALGPPDSLERIADFVLDQLYAKPA